MSEQWKPSSVGGTVISDTPNRPYPDDQDVAYYGGHLVAESIPNEEYVNLIAAAPDLLEACQAVLPLGKDELEFLDKGIGTATKKAAWLKVRAAIAKAKGGE